LTAYFHQYFGSGSYQTLKEKINLGEIKLVVAVRYADTTKKIFSKGVAVEVDGGQVIPLIFFEKNKILTVDRKVIVDVPVVHYNYFGWQLNDPMPTKPSKYVTVTYYFNGGGSAADDIFLEWDAKNKVFSVHDFEDEAE
jgi:hypothetical protein